MSLSSPERETDGQTVQLSLSKHNNLNVLCRLEGWRDRNGMSSSQSSQHFQDFIDRTINGLLSDGLDDAKSRCIESCEKKRENLINQLKLEILSAREEVGNAQQSLLRKKENLKNLKYKLESETIKLVANLKSTELESESFRKYLNEVLVFILFMDEIRRCGGGNEWFDKI